MNVVICAIIYWCFDVVTPTTLATSVAVKTKYIDLTIETQAEIFNTFIGGSGLSKPKFYIGRPAVSNVKLIKSHPRVCIETQF